MTTFLRETFEKKNIVTQDNLSISGTLKKGQGTIPAGTVVAFEAATLEWVKYVSATHGIGIWALGVTKEDIVTTSTESAIGAILKAGIINSKEVSINGELQNLLMVNGIAVL